MMSELHACQSYHNAVICVAIAPLLLMSKKIREHPSYRQSTPTAVSNLEQRSTAL